MLVLEFLAKNKTVIMAQPPYSPQLLDGQFTEYPSEIIMIIMYFYISGSGKPSVAIKIKNKNQ